mmetsp:Transcript_23522/g.51619  ORF Transcript_23522/g.51619 Transcript_23522/m.51619 type:complete len:903 (+) Transcript_23522:219-2927(+)
MGLFACCFSPSADVDLRVKEAKTVPHTDPATLDASAKTVGRSGQGDGNANVSRCNNGQQTSSAEQKASGKADIATCSSGPTDSLKDAVCVEDVEVKSAEPAPPPEKPSNVPDPEAAALVKQGYPHAVNKLGPPVPPCEEDRLKTLEALGLLEAPPDPELESILRLVQSIFKSPSALVALFGDKRIFIKDAQGAFGRGDFPWRWSFCGWTMASDTHQIMVIPDATKDARFADNVMVSSPDGPGVRFYCGTPLVASNGHRLGTLCFIDTKPREFDACQAAILNNLAEMVVRHVEKDRILQLKQHDNKALSNAYTQLQRAMDCFEHCVVLVDTSDPQFKMLYINAAWTNVTGVERDPVVGASISEALELISGGQLPNAEHMEDAKAGRQFTITGVRPRGSANANKKLCLRFRPASNSGLDEGALPVGVPSFLKSQNGNEASSSLYFMSVEMPAPTSRQSVLSGSIAVSETTDVVEGLCIGHLLGKGAYGSVYSGTWFGTDVAIKVVDQEMKPMDENAGGSLEALLGVNLRHPHICATLKYIVRRNKNMSGSVSQPFSDDTARASHTANFSVGPNSRQHTSKGSASTTSSVNNSAQASRSAAGNNSSSQAPQHTSANVQNSKSSAGGWAVIDYAQADNQHIEEDDEMDEDVSDSMMKHLMPTSCSSFAGDHSALFRPSPENSCNSRQMPSRRDTIQTWIIMEYCDKGCLQDAVDRGWLRDVRSVVRGVPNMPGIIATAFEMASALNYLHSQGIIHGDLSAFNVMLTTVGANATKGNRGFVAKIADFGLARCLDIKTKIETKTYGTITHQPPETLTSGIVSKAVDVYAFGVLLWQMYCGSRPWAGMSHGQIIMTVVSQANHLRFPPGTPAPFEKLASACMSFKAENRPTFEAVTQMLQQMQDESLIE